MWRGRFSLCRANTASSPFTHEAMLPTRGSLGQRVSCRRSVLGAQYLHDNRDELVLGTCEAFCPIRQAYWVVFDDPFESLLSPHESKRQRKGISIAVLDSDDYLLYDDWPYAANAGFGGTCLIKTSKSKQLHCAWFGKWFSANEFQSLHREPDEPLLCLCRRLETAEPPPPNRWHRHGNKTTGGGGGGGDEDDEDDDDGEEGGEELLAASKLIECDKCKEWFHSECVERMCKISDKSFSCPLCRQLLVPPGGRYRSLLKPSTSTDGEGGGADAWLKAVDVPPKRRAKWVENCPSQRFWKDNALLEWQFWARHSGGGGYWVVCLATFRRWVGVKLKRLPSVAAAAPAASSSSSSTDNTRGLHLLLTLPLPPRPLPLHEYLTAHVLHAAPPASAAAARVVSPPPQPLLLSSLTSPPPPTRERTPQLPSGFPACTRLRTFDEHTLFARSKRQKLKSHSASSSSSSSHSSSSFTSSSVNTSLIENLSTFGRKRNLRFAKSLIEGWGVFTEESVKAGDFVIEYKGEIVSKDEAEVRFARYTALGLPDYLFTLDATWICDATMRGSMARFINHSCDPNCYSTIVTHGGRKKIGIFALRDIKVGEELCYDYKFQEDADPNNKITCNCGAKHCRRVLN